MSDGPSHRLPLDFSFGVSTSAFSIEGAATQDGRTESIWDAVAAVPGRTADGSTGAGVVDHYHRWAQDVDLLTDLGVDAYRFSVSWSRVQPEGRASVNQAGLDFYDRLIDGLLSAGIEPWVTVYHWDLPLELMMAGGWLNRDTADELGDLAELLADRFGDRVRRWTTMAAPVQHMAYGHALGVDAPGLTLLGGAFAVTHHLLLGHARAREALAARSGALVGISNHHTLVSPAGPGADDHRAAALYDAYHNRQFAEPILLGRYPRLLRPLVEADPTLIHDGDLAAISAPLDFYGVSFYHPTVVAAAPDNNTIPFTLVDVPGRPVTDNEWAIEPEALTGVLTELVRRYPRIPPIVVTENGAAYSDPDDVVGHLRDQDRIHYLAGHLAAVAAAVGQGVDVRGYFHRGLTDAWEGSEGFTLQFGLVKVAPESGERTPRSSFEFFRAVIAEHRARRDT